MIKITTDLARTRRMQSAGCEIYFDTALERAVSEPEYAGLSEPISWFDPFNPALHAQAVSSGGRAGAWFIRIAAQACVLRFYRRGGFAAKILRDQYLWLGTARTRALSEFSLMQSMSLAGLPVPMPLAAAIWRHGLIYRQALIPATVEGASPLALMPDTDVWIRAGRVIAQMHDAGVWHADLNVFNLLVDAQKQVWLIDFDRARAGLLLTQSQCNENLSRLLRSVRKVAPALERECWPALIQAYTLSRQSV